MRLVSQYRKYSRLSIVLTKENLMRLQPLIEAANSVGFHVRMRHEYKGVADREYLEMYDRIIPGVIKDVVDKEYGFYPYFFYEMVNPFWEHEMEHICGRNFFVIDPNLDVRVCLAQETKIGNMRDKGFDFMTNMKQSNHPRFGYKEIDECECCEFKLLCGSGCPLTKKLAFGRTGMPSPFCKTFKKVFPMVFEMKRRWLKSQRAVRF